ncbi:hypothetical protein DL768_008352 [Monosporascus sp. mg162]|nr:hypothetical protein DL768_008352 [Monosporascus sp. mg162]
MSPRPSVIPVTAPADAASKAPDDTTDRTTNVIAQSANCCTQLYRPVNEEISNIRKKLTNPLPTPPTVCPNPPATPPTAPGASPAPSAFVVSPTALPGREPPGQ